MRNLESRPSSPGRLSRKPEAAGRARARAESLAERHHIEIELTRGGAINIWPPKTVPSSADPFHGHHYASDWDEALAMIRTYSAQAATKAASR